MKLFSRSRRSRLIRFFTSLVTVFTTGSVILFSTNGLEYSAPTIVVKIAEILSALLLAGLFYSAIGLLIGRRASWIVAVIILIISAIWEAVQLKNHFSLLIIEILGALGIVIANYRYYPHKSEPSAIWIALKGTLTFTALSTLVACIGIFILSVSEHHSFSPLRSIIASIDHMYVLSNVFEPIAVPSPGHIFGRIFLFTIGLLNYTLIALALLKPVIDRFNASSHTYRRVLRILDTHGISSEDYFKYFPNDKSYFFSSRVDGFIAYGVSKHVCVALADPVAKDDWSRALLLEDFSIFTTKQNWQVCFLPVVKSKLPFYKKHGLTSIQLGSNAIVSTKEFVQTTAKNKHFRYIDNHFTTLGYTTRILKPPHNHVVFQQIRSVSDQWLGRSGRKERQFAMGFFDEQYLQNCELFVTYDRLQNIQAFVSIVPSYSSQRISFDLIRYSKIAPRDTSAFLFSRLITHLESIHCPEFDMGLAPLSGLEQLRNIDERGLHLLFLYSNRWFGFKGLRSFKAKFKPHWEARYAVYQGHRITVPGLIIELNRLMRRVDPQE